MKRFLSLLAMAAVPAVSVTADAATQQQQTSGGYADKVKSCVCMRPTSARDECWLARTDIGLDFGRIPSRLVTKDRLYNLWSLNTIQPIWRADDMHNTFLGFAGIGTARWEDVLWNVGVGYRHMTAAADHIFGIGVAYRDFDLRNLHFRGPQAYIEWLTQYTTLTLGRAWERMHVTHHATRHFLRHHHHNRFEPTSLDLSFQVPGLPWTQIMLGRSWFGEKVGRKCFKSFRDNSFKKLDYGLRLNLLGCLALEGGYLGGWGQGEYVRLVLNLGRPASNEYTLADGFLGNEIFTPRDLRNYTTVPVARERIDGIAKIK